MGAIDIIRASPVSGKKIGIEDQRNTSLSAEGFAARGAMCALFLLRLAPAALDESSISQGYHHDIAIANEGRTLVQRSALISARARKSCPRFPLLTSSGSARTA